MENSTLRAPQSERIPRPPVEVRASQTSVRGVQEVFGPYVLIEPVGAGGWARVYRGYRADDPMHVWVAIKRPVRGGEQARKRFQNEAALAQLLDSPRIVAVREQGMVGDRPFIAFEYVDGITLERLIRRVHARERYFPLEIQLTILIEIARALEVAHGFVRDGSGRVDPIIHCDLKPSNVLIARDGSVKLTDFGTAQQGSWIPEPTAGVLGTLAYVAPERVGPGREQAIVGPHTDLFSLGVIAYELCLLRGLFVGSSSQIIEQLLHADRYIEQALAALPPQTNPRFRSVLSRLLEVAPERRMQQAGQVISPLTEILEKLNLTGDLEAFVEPYLEGTWDDDGDTRLTKTLPGLPPPVLPDGRQEVRITHLTDERLRALVRRSAEHEAGPQSMKQQRSQQRRRILYQVAALLFVALGIAATLLARRPTRLDISSEPVEALVSIQPGCEGDFSTLEIAPFSHYTRGPWPVCLRFEAAGFVPVTQRLARPEAGQHVLRAQQPLVHDACVTVGSRPVGLPIYIANQRRGVTKIEDTTLCGLAPDLPYVVQLEHSGVRWDVADIQAEPGETLKVFRDFGREAKSKASPMERCRRNFEAEEFKRAIEICRVAVVENESYPEKVEAYILQGRTLVALDDTLTGCKRLHQALSIAVYHRDVALESQVLDLRYDFGCDELEAQSWAASEAESAGTGDGEAAGAFLASPQGKTASDSSHADLVNAPDQDKTTKSGSVPSVETEPGGRVNEEPHTSGEKGGPADGGGNPVKEVGNQADGVENPVKKERNPADGGENPVKKGRNPADGGGNPVKEERNPAGDDAGISVEKTGQRPSGGAKVEKE